MSTLIPAPPLPVAPPLPSPAPALPRPEVVIDGRVRIPAGVVDLDSFCDWQLSDARPEFGRFCYLDGVIWVDLTMEQLFDHNDMKEEFAGVLRTLARTAGSGRYFGAGVTLRHDPASLATVPDGLFVLHTTFDCNRVTAVPGQQHGHTYLNGVPDMVLEVVSDSSVEKDYTTLPVLYHRAGVPEFWRADGRADLRFEILRWSEAGYVPAQLADGWWHSALFGCDFRLTTQQDVGGRPEFFLHVRRQP